MRKTFAVSVLSMGLLTCVTYAAKADEVIIERHRAAPVEVVPAAPPVVIERRQPDCTTSRTHTEDDTGASSTVTRRDCD